MPSRIFGPFALIQPLFVEEGKTTMPCLFSIENFDCKTTPGEKCLKALHIRLDSNATTEEEKKFFEPCAGEIYKKDAYVGAQAQALIQQKLESKEPGGQIETFADYLPTFKYGEWETFIREKYESINAFKLSRYLKERWCRLKPKEKSDLIPEVEQIIRLVEDTFPKQRKRLNQALRIIRNDILDIRQEYREDDGGAEEEGEVIVEEPEEGTKGSKKNTLYELPKWITRYTDISCPCKVWVKTPRISVVIRLIVIPSNLSVVKSQPLALREEYPVRVRIEAHSFDVLNEPEQEIPILPGEDSPPLVFDLHPRMIGPTHVIIDFFQTGNPVGTISVSIEVTENEVSIINETIPGKNLPMGSQVKPPDLMLFISLNRFYEQFSLIFTLIRAGEIGRTFKPIPLQTNPETYAMRMYERISGLSRRKDPTTEDLLDIERTLPVGDVDRRIKQLGQKLWFELIPDDLKSVYANEREQWQKKTLLIISDEPYLPWELIWPYGHSPEKWEDKGPWCETVNLTRWLRRDAQGNGNEAAPFNFQLGRLACIAPTDSGLTSAQEEIEIIRKLMNRHGIEDLSPDEPIWSKVINLLEHNCYHWLHIAAHGKFHSDSPDSDSAVFLQDFIALTPDSFVGPEIEGHIKRQRPGFFFNACHSGRQGRELTRLGGWANRLLSQGACLFLAPLWIVSDCHALKFAEIFYGKLFEGSTVSEAVKEARLSAKSTGDPTWMAYSVYAHPNARIISL
jgi:hypothetical protein